MLFRILIFIVILMVILMLIFMLILMPNILMTLMVVLHTWVVLQRQNCVLRCFLPRFVAKHREPYNTYKGDNHESVDTHHYYNKNHLSFKLS